MKINGPWYESSNDSALSKVSETQAVKNLQALVAENLKSLEGFEVNPELLEEALRKTAETLQSDKPQIKILDSRQEGDVLIVDVEVPLNMAHLLDRTNMQGA